METALYGPVKAFLETHGYSVKGEIGGCDLVGLRDGEPPVVVIGELKLSFTLELVLQAVGRATAADEVWLAAAMSRRGKGRESDGRFRNLCRRLGFGMLGVTADGAVEVLVAPDAPFPRKDSRLRSRLVREHKRRRGDPMAGGSAMRAPVMTAYRQQALDCARAMQAGPRSTRDLRATLPDASKILQFNAYGWFERVERGVYSLTSAGEAALQLWPEPPADNDEAVR